MKSLKHVTMLKLECQNKQESRRVEYIAFLSTNTEKQVRKRPQKSVTKDTISVKKIKLGHGK